MANSALILTSSYCNERYSHKRVYMEPFTYIRSFLPLIGFCTAIIGALKQTSHAFCLLPCTTPILPNHYPILRHFNTNITVLGSTGELWYIAVSSCYEMHGVNSNVSANELVCKHCTPGIHSSIGCSYQWNLHSIIISFPLYKHYNNISIPVTSSCIHTRIRYLSCLQ